MSFQQDPRQPVPPPYGNSYEGAPYGQPQDQSYDRNIYGQTPYQDQPGTYRGDYGPTSTGASPDDRMWAMVSHLGSFLAAWIALGLLCPIFVLLARSNRPFVREHAYESLNFQLNALVIAVVGGFVGVVMGLLTLGLGFLLVIPIAIAYVIWYCVFVCLATAAANRGEAYRYPAIVRVFNS